MQVRSQRAIIRLFIATATGTILIVALGAIAVQFVFTNTRNLPIGSAKNMSNSIIVTVTGRLYTKGINKFLLKDSTGAAQIDTCPTWFRRIIIPTGEQVTITGELLEMPADTIGAKYRLAAYVIQQRGEPDIVLRTTPGKPPWADSAFIPRVR